MRAPLLMFLFVAITLFARAAGASAVYAWVPEDPNGCCRGVMELSDAAYLAGGTSWTPGFPLEGNPVERFHFEGRFKVSELHPASRGSRDVDLVITFAATPETERCCAWDFQLAVDGKGLKGRLRVTTQNDDIILSGTDSGWRIERAGTDAISSGVICGSGASDACMGDRGKWVLISAPDSVHKVGAHRSESASTSPSFPLR